MPFTAWPIPRLSMYYSMNLRNAIIHRTFKQANAPCKFTITTKKCRIESSYTQHKITNMVLSFTKQYLYPFTQWVSILLPSSPLIPKTKLHRHANGLTHHCKQWCNPWLKGLNQNNDLHNPNLFTQSRMAYELLHGSNAITN